MRRALLPLTALLTAFSTGCQVTSLAAFDELYEKTSYREISNGTGGAVFLDRNPTRQGARYLVATPDGLRPLESPTSLQDSQVVGDTIFICSGERIVRRPLVGKELGPPEPIGTVRRLRDFRVDSSGKLVVASRPGGVIVFGTSGTAAERAGRLIWRGDALAIAFAGPDSVWIASRAPLAVIERIRLSDGRIEIRTPLPRDLENPSLVLVPSGPNLAAYVLGGNLLAALFVFPEAGMAVMRGALGTWNPAPGAFPGSPRVLEVAGRPEGERIQSDQSRWGSNGRIAALPGGEFLVISDDRTDYGGVALGIIHLVGGDPARPAEQRVEPPGDWPPLSIEGLAWDAKGATLVAGEHLVRVEGRQLRLDDNPHGKPRRKASYGQDATVLCLRVALETLVYLPVNAALSVAAVPFATVLVPIGGREVLPYVFAPLWWPWTYTFDIDLGD